MPEIVEPENTQAPAPRTREDVLAFVKQLEAAVNTWQARHESELATRSAFEHQTTAPSLELPNDVINALTVLLAGVDTDHADPDARELVLAAESLIESAQNRTDKSPLWNREAWLDLLAARLPAQRRMVESPTQLRAQGVNLAQIAKSLKWRDWRNEPDTVKVDEELREPGRHFNPADHTHPLDAAHDAEVSNQWRQRVERRAAARKQASEVVPPAPKRCPESLDELVEQHVSVRQICKMKGLTAEQVLARMEELGVPEYSADEARPRSARESRLKADQDVLTTQRREASVAHINPHHELSPDNGARARAMLRDGHSVRDATFVLMLRNQMSLSYARRIVERQAEILAKEGAAQTKESPAQATG